MIPALGFISNRPSSGEGEDQVTDNKGMLALPDVLLDRCELTVGHPNLVVPTDDDPHAPSYSAASNSTVTAYTTP